MAKGDSPEVLKAKAQKGEEIRKGRTSRPTPKGQFRTDNPCILSDGSVDPACKKVYQRSVAGRQTLSQFISEKFGQGMSEKDVFMSAVDGLMKRRLGYVGAYLDSKNPGRTYNRNQAMAIVDAVMSKMNVGENPGARLSGPSGGGRQRGKAPEAGKAGASVRQQRKASGGRGGGMGMPETWQRAGTGVDQDTVEKRRERGMPEVEPGQLKSDLNRPEARKKAPTAAKPKPTPEQEQAGIDPTSPVQQRLRDLSRKPEPTGEQAEKLDQLLAARDEMDPEEFQSQFMALMKEISESGGAQRESLRKVLEDYKNNKGIRKRQAPPIPGSKSDVRRQTSIETRKEKEKGEREALQEAARKGIARKKASAEKVDEETPSLSKLLGGKLETTKEDWKDLRDEDEEEDLAPEPGEEQAAPGPEAQPGKLVDEDKGVIRSIYNKHYNRLIEDLTDTSIIDVKLRRKSALESITDEDLDNLSQYTIDSLTDSYGKMDKAKELAVRNYLSDLGKSLLGGGASGATPAPEAGKAAPASAAAAGQMAVKKKIDDKLKQIGIVRSEGDKLVLKTTAGRVISEDEPDFKKVLDTFGISEDEFANYPRETATQSTRPGAGQAPEPPEPPAEGGQARQVTSKGGFKGPAQPRKAGGGGFAGKFTPSPKQVNEVMNSLKKPASGDDAVEQYFQGTLFPAGLITDTADTNPLEGGGSVPEQAAPGSAQTPTAPPGQGSLLDEEGNPRDFTKSGPAPEATASRRPEVARQIPLNLGRENTAEKLKQRAGIEQRRLAKQEKALGKPPKPPRRRGKAPVQQEMFTPSGNPRRFAGSPPASSGTMRQAPDTRKGSIGMLLPREQRNNPPQGEVSPAVENPPSQSPTQRRPGLDAFARQILNVANKANQSREAHNAARDRLPENIRRIIPRFSEEEQMSYEEFAGTIRSMMR